MGFHSFHPFLRVVPLESLPYAIIAFHPQTMVSPFTLLMKEAFFDNCLVSFPPLFQPNEECSMIIMIVVSLVHDSRGQFETKTLLAPLAISLIIFLH